MGRQAEKISMRGGSSRDLGYIGRGIGLGCTREQLWMRDLIFCLEKEFLKFQVLFHWGIFVVRILQALAIVSKTLVGGNVVGSSVVEYRVHLVAQDGNISRFWDMHWPRTLRCLGSGKAMLLLDRRASVTHDRSSWYGTRVIAMGPCKGRKEERIWMMRVGGLDGRANACLTW